MPDEVYRNGGAEQGTGGGVLSAAQASAASNGTEQRGAKASGIDKRRDKPQTTPECLGCPECQPGGSAGYVFG